MRAPFIDHITVKVRDLAASRAFYEAALAPFATRVVPYGDDEIAIGPRAARTWGSRRASRAPRSTSPSSPTIPRRWTPSTRPHKAGGTDNGAPGRRPQYHERYFAAYVLDPDGNNVEAVCHNGPDGSEAVAPPV